MNENKDLKSLESFFRDILGFEVTILPNNDLWKLKKGKMVGRLEWKTGDLE